MMNKNLSQAVGMWQDNLTIIITITATTTIILISSRPIHIWSGALLHHAIPASENKLCRASDRCQIQDVSIPNAGRCHRFGRKVHLPHPQRPGLRPSPAWRMAQTRRWLPALGRIPLYSPELPGFAAESSKLVLPKEVRDMRPSSQSHEHPLKSLVIAS